MVDIQRTSHRFLTEIRRAIYHSGGGLHGSQGCYLPKHTKDKSGILSVLSLAMTAVFIRPRPGQDPVIG